MTTRDREIIVVGAGPAGAGLAAQLASSGRDVLLLERDRFPRDKLCGEFLSAEAVPVLERLGLRESLRELAPASVRRFRLTTPNGRELLRPLEAPGLGLSRRRFDELLARAAVAAGAELRECCRVVAARSAEKGFVVDALESGAPVTWRARGVVLAAGRLARLDGAPTRGLRAAPWVAWKQHHVAEGAGTDAVEIHVFPGGYCGVNEVEGGAMNVCLIARTELLAEAGGNLRVLVARAAACNPALGRRLAALRPVGEAITTAGTSIAWWRRRPRGVLAVGDAAGMIAPVCGDGMAMALRSAALALPFLQDVLAGRMSWASALSRHHAACMRELGRRLVLGRLVHAALLHGVTAQALVRLGQVAPGAADWLIRSTRDAPGEPTAVPPATCRGGSWSSC